MSADHNHGGDNLYRIPADNIWANAWKLAAVLGSIGLIGSAFGAASNPERFAFSWLFAFYAFLTFALGAVFFVLIQHLTVSHWSVTVRRTAEFFAAGIPVFALLFVPVALNADTLYEWVGHGASHEEGHDDGAEHEGEEHSSGESLVGASTARAQAPQEADAHGADADGHAAPEAHGPGAHNSPQHQLHGELLEHKAPYLSLTGWYVRAGIYFILWFIVAFFFFRHSVQQDEDKSLDHTRKMQAFAPAAAAIFTLTLSFAAIDWIMSLEPTWYSTIYGVYIFAGTVITIHALIIVVVLGMKEHGLIGSAVNIEHFHDLGKLMFGFIVFHAYVGFSQMMLQWYANIPEEIIYYHERWHAEGWKGVSYFLIFGHFVLPFLFLISRVTKLRLSLLSFGAMWMLFMQIVDIYWFVMPNASDGFSPHWLDITSLLAVGGVYFGVVFFIMKFFPLIPIGDPRLERSLGHVVT
ncbi:MAG: hypothetical protein DRJ42_21170 [Deltaproteobacteria bacterium]|nr:MAG: hypothetical protein DRJ42_21170 [Deltaproteobacteria bacterium]